MFQLSPKHKRIRANAKDIVDRINSGEVRMSEEARRLGCSVSYLSKLRKEIMGDDCFDPRAERYSAEDIDLILELRESGMRVKEIAEKFDRSPGSISHLLQRYKPTLNVPPELTKSSLRAITNKEVDLDGCRYLANHKNNKPHVVLPLDDYLRLTSNTE